MFLRRAYNLHLNMKWLVILQSVSAVVASGEVERVHSFDFAL